ncbi:chitinase [Streptomyces sp. NPDC048644]|uniref:chitinase n=1 Tax=Streptomyces sp. NPDC048644 TaxID=3365582 RepID=UPI00371C57C8
MRIRHPRRLVGALGACLALCATAGAQAIPAPHTAKITVFAGSLRATVTLGRPAARAPQAVAPYLYNGWGDPPDPAEVMDATGTGWFTLAFVLDAGGCEPQWDGSRPLKGGADQKTVEAVRAKGGDVLPSFGGAGGKKLEESCADADALAGAYQKVIDTYRLKAVDVDIEGDTYDDPAVQQKTIDALKKVRADNAGLKVYVTFPSEQEGPDGSMIGRAADCGLEADGWTIMPFDFDGAGRNMAELTERATDGLMRRVKAAYGYDEAEAYRHSGLSSMNGVTDMNEKVTTRDFASILRYARQHRLARLAFWSVNRDRPCPGAYPDDDTCSGVDQQPWQFSRTFARYTD